MVRATPTLSTKWLLPRLRRFLDAKPDLEVRIDATNEPTDFSPRSGGYRNPSWRGALARLFVEGLAEERFLPVCAPGLCARRHAGAPDLPRYRLIHSVKSQMQWARWFALAGVQPASGWRRVLFDRSHMAIDAAVDGVGIALESDLMMWRELADGALACPVREPPASS